MKQLSVLFIAFSAIFCLTACGESETSSNNAETPAETSQAIFDVTQFANISSTELMALMGEPDNITESTTSEDFVEIPCSYYDYSDTETFGDISFTIINDNVVQFTASNEFAYTGNEEELLADFHVEKSELCAMMTDTDTELRYRCPTDEIDDLWINNIENSSFDFLQVTYDMFYFEEWYMPMTTSEQAKYLSLTQEYIKDRLDVPESAVFPNISEWKFGKNPYYTATTSYVNAKNSLGFDIGCEFSLVYNAETSELVYAVYNGTIVVDNGYMETSDLVAQLITETIIADDMQMIPVKDETSDRESGDSNSSDSTSQEAAYEEPAPEEPVPQEPTYVEPAPQEPVYEETNDVQSLLPQRNSINDILNALDEHESSSGNYDLDGIN